jgi:predicted ribosome quality control (RQC) complex YloA/Tae2 family protein
LKEEMSSFDIAVITNELMPIVNDARIDTVYQTNPKTILLKLRSPRQPSQLLLIEAGKRIHLTSYDLEKPQRPPNFCMALRKHLRNGRITGISQHEFERIVIMTVRRRDGEYQLIAELFGEGNLILVGPNGEILQALRYRRMRDRNVVPKEKYVHAPPSGSNPMRLRREDLAQLKKFDDLSVVRALTRLLSLGGSYAEEVLLRAEIDKDTPSISLTDENLEGIFGNLRELLRKIAEMEIEPCIFVDEKGRSVDVTPVMLKRYAGLKCMAHENFNAALDDYYAKSLTRKRVGGVEEQTEKELKRLQIILQDQERTLKEQTERVGQNRIIGDIIYRHMNELQLLLNRIMEEKRSGREWNEIIGRLQEEKQAADSPAVYFDGLTPKNLMLQVSVEGQTFQLDLRSSIHENASGYYSRAKKAERKIPGAKKAIGQTKTRMKNAKGRALEETKEASKPPLVKPKRRWYEKFHWFHSSDGFLVIGGRDASTNEVLIRRYMEPNDRVFHTDIPGAPFVLIKTEGKTPPEQTIEEAAQLAASYSRAWKEMLMTANVYWVSPEQVKKQPPSGQYLTKGAFMIYGNRNYVRNVSVETAIGITREDDVVRAIGGPTTAIAKHTNLYVKLIPGNQTSSKLAKQIIYKLAKMAPAAEQKDILSVSVEEVQRFIPLGRGVLST